jgi:osmoprotectant transport system substrate-binding protein
MWRAPYRTRLRMQGTQKAGHTMRFPRTTIVAGLSGLALALAACGSSGGGATTTTSDSPQPQSLGAITIGAFDFNESKILAYLYAGALQKAGYEPTVKVVGNREVTQPALEKGAAGGGVDVVPEYLATFTTFLNGKKNGADAQSPASGDVDATLAAGQTLANEVDTTLLTPSAATDQNAFAVTKDFASQNNLTTLSDLAGYSGDLVLGGPPECPTRPFCQPGLEQTYGIHFTGFKSLDAGGPLTKKAISDGTVQIGLVFSSDGGIDALGLQVLDDDKHLQAADNVVPAVNTAVVSDALTAALDGVSAVLTTEDLIAMNKQADIDRKDAEDVAADYLQSKGLS